MNPSPSAVGLAHNYGFFIHSDNSHCSKIIIPYLWLKKYDFNGLAVREFFKSNGAKPLDPQLIEEAKRWFWHPWEFGARAENKTK